VSARPLLELDAVCRHYVSGATVVRALDDCSLSIWAGEFVAIMGQSGSGKSTLMNVIGCLDRPTSGRYRIDGEDVAGLDGDGLAALRRDTFGFIFQRYNLLPTATAEGCGLRVAELAPARVADVDIVGLEIEFEPGYQYRLIVIARARTLDCAPDARGSERRLAYRGRLLVMSRDAAAASRLFDAEMQAAIEVLGRDVAAHLDGRPRG